MVVGLVYIVDVAALIVEACPLVGVEVVDRAALADVEETGGYAVEALVFGDVGHLILVVGAGEGEAEAPVLGMGRLRPRVNSTPELFMVMAFSGM